MTHDHIDADGHPDAQTPADKPERFADELARSDGDSEILDSLERIHTAVGSPEHTGQNRCLPCTLVNAVGVAVVAILVARRRRPLGVLIALLGAAAIWLRGYVVPGTPRFAPRLVAPLPVDIGPDHPSGLDSGSISTSLGDAPPTDTSVDANGDPAVDAGDDPAVDTSTGPDTADPSKSDVSTAPQTASPAPSPSPDDGSAAVDLDGAIAPESSTTAPDPPAVLETLIDIGVLVDDGDRLVLDEAFREAVRDRIEALRDGSDDALAARAASLAGDGVEGETHNGRILLASGRDTWLSRPVALAETALATELRDRDVDVEVARAAARPLRAFVATCPACDGPVSDTTLRKCCGGPGGVSGNPERPVRACDDCNAIVFADAA